MLVFFTNLSLMEFMVRYLVLFHLFSVIDSIGWFWMGSLHPVNVGVHQGSIVGATLSLLCIKGEHKKFLKKC